MKPLKLLYLVLPFMFIATGFKSEPEKVDEFSKLLLQAAAKGDIAQVKSLLSKGADVNAKDDYGRTLLHCAAVKGHKNIVEFLLTKGARIDPRDNAERTPLHYAAGAGWIYGVIGGDIGIAKSLLNKGANINATDRVGWTALHYATQVRNKAMVELLVERGADLNATNERGHTAFTLARGMPTRYRGHSAESERVKLCSEIAQVLRKHMAVYYVASDGRDSNPGTLESPFRTLPAAIDVAMPGDIIVVRGGLYACSSSISIDTSGEAGRPICLRAYPDETPVFDFSAAKGDGFLITGAYWHIKGLTVTGAEYWGIVVETKGGHHNILEQLRAYANGGTGVFVLNGAANNLILNCDSYRNFDPQTNGENADGFAAARALGKGNVLIGCRAWNNADDGFDSGMGDAGVRLENCYVWRNGENIWGHPCFTGNANGFKLGRGAHVLIRCMAWDHPVRGFKLQREATGVTLYNCTAFRNRTNYQFIWPTSNIEKNVLRNCLSFKGGISIKPKVDDKHNSWNKSLGSEITQDDFLGLDDSVITRPRNPDGSLPESNFLRLASGSDAIDAGTDVGLPFVGKSPDLGAFEYHPAATGKQGPKMLNQVVRDRDIEQIRALLSKGTEVNEKDWLGYTALHWAIYFGYLDVAEVLISEGANPNIKSDTGRTLLEIGTEMGYERLAELLRKHGAME
jgi:ankyrin repeat protein